MNGGQIQTSQAASLGIEPSAQSIIPDVESTNQSPANDSILTNLVETQILGSNQTMQSQIVRPKLPELVLNIFKGV